MKTKQVMLDALNVIESISLRENFSTHAVEWVTNVVKDLRQAIADCEQAEKQEPLAFATHTKYHQDLSWNRKVDIEECNNQPLYINPSSVHKKLTDEEIEKVWFDNNAIFDYNIFARVIEAKVLGGR